MYASQRATEATPARHLPRLFDRAFAALDALSSEGASDHVRAYRSEARRLLTWVVGWLDEPYRAPSFTASGSARASAVLRDVADELAELAEALEADPLANANAIQVATLGYAVVGSVAASCEREERAIRSTS